MRQGGIFNGGSALGELGALGAVILNKSEVIHPGHSRNIKCAYNGVGEIDEEMEQIAEQWSRGALTPTLRVPDQITDWDSDADRAAIIAADQAKLDAEKKAGVTPSGSGGWAGLTDLQKLGIAVAGVLVVGAIWKAMKPSRSYASTKRRVSRNAKSYSKGYSQYGAFMGRPSGGLAGKKLHLERVRLDRGGYDPGGAYWGLGSPLWVAYDNEGNEKFFRAANRSAAKSQLPGHTFYR